MPVPRILFPASVLLLLILLAAGCGKDKENGGQPAAGTQAATAGLLPAPFPTGFDYPQDASTIQGWVQTGMTSGGGKPERVHGFNLWAGLNQPTASGEPVWRTWYTTTQTFGDTHVDGKVNCSEVTSLNARNQSNASVDADQPINFPDAPYYPVPTPVKNNPAYANCYCAELDEKLGTGLVDGKRFQNNGDIMIAGVMYNQAAHDWITTQKLNLSTTLSALMPKAGEPAADMPPMPAGSIVLKVMQWPVKATGLTLLPVWDPETAFDADGGKYAGYEIQSLWKKAVAISPDGSGSASSLEYLYKVYESDKTTELGPNAYTNPTVVPIDSFYHEQYSQADLDALDPCDRALLDAVAYYSWNRAFQANDYLVTIAMHIMTKEQPIWTFQSAWWSDTPNDGRFAKHRPVLPQAKGPWHQYLLTTTYGQRQKTPSPNDHSYANWPKSTTVPGTDDWPVAYNPYIELAAAHPIATNCMNCHHRAGWPTRLDKQGVHATYLSEPPQPPGALAIFNDLKTNSILPPYAKAFEGLLMTDSQWSLSDRAHRPRK